MIAANGGYLVLPEESDDPVGKWPVADEVAGADYPVDPHCDQMGPGKLKGDRVAMNVGDQPQLHRPGSLLGDEAAANSADRRVAASTASIKAPRTPPRSSACNPAMVVPPGLAT